MKMLVCKHCGQALIEGVDTCLGCVGLHPDSGKRAEAEVPEYVTCEACGIRKPTAEILQHHSSIPYFNSHTNTYYCGCRGWD